MVELNLIDEKQIKVIRNKNIFMIISKALGIGIIGSVVLLAFHLSKEHNNKNLMLFIITSIMLPSLIINIIIYKFKKKPKKSIGTNTIKISSQKIEFKKESQVIRKSIKELNRINIYSDYYKGFTIEYDEGESFPSTGLIRSEFFASSNKGIHVNAIIENLNDLNKSANIIKEWYIKSHININEYKHKKGTTIFDNRPLLLKNNSFNELQTLKKELNIKGFYI